MALNPIENLRNLLIEQERWHEPWTTGTIKLSDPELTLFFKCKDGSSRHIQLGTMTESDLEALLDACQPASFGRGSDNVFDETYRKAWKMDAGVFSWLFNPDSGRFVADLAQGFCPWDSLDRGIRVEPYKLNVYGKGGFFKSHKDTPRTLDMFGSLVIVLPMEHKGGNLLLHHRGRELDFYAPTFLKGAPQATVAYVAFYSDVDHEVLEVTAGHRVTITFNLFFDPARASPVSDAQHLRIPDNPFTVALRQNLCDKTFVNSYQYLGFGFEYSYPKRADEYDGNLIPCLKGPDAFLFRALTELGARPQLRYLYRSEYGSCDFWVMLTYPVEGRRTNEASSQTELEYLLQNPDSNIVWANGKSEDSTASGERAIYRRHPWFVAYLHNPDYYRARTLPVEWVTPPNDNLVGRSKWVELGNEPALEIFYYAVCILIDVTQLDFAPRA
ncbi:hypothetical protein AN958_09623 [Leucoagaricus sp. SymC.cos]|nr:hypothetical protein AN958_09623 [Leucoagaricus sp. SymC.cos]